MVMEKRAQSNAAAITLIVIVLVILIVLLLVLFFYPRFTGNVSKTLTSKLVCNSPYILVGDSCCLDQNNNKICDSDEASVSTTPSTTTVTITPNPTSTSTSSTITCRSPYIRKGNICCLDDDRNGICDSEEEYSSPYITRRANIDDPFHISSIELYADSISIELKNTGDEDIIVRNIDIDDCGSENFNRQLNEGQRKSFNIDCDDDNLRKIDSDFTVRYTDLNGNDTQYAEGSLRIERRYSSEYNDYYSDY